MSPAPTATSPGDLIKRAGPVHMQQRARRGNQCTHTKECVPAPPCAAHSRAEPEEPRRCAKAPHARAAPSRAALSGWGAREILES